MSSDSKFSGADPQNPTMNSSKTHCDDTATPTHVATMTDYDGGILNKTLVVEPRPIRLPEGDDVELIQKFFAELSSKQDIAWKGEDSPVISKDKIQRMVMNTLIEARYKKEEVAMMSWHYATRGLSVFWRSDCNPDKPSDMTKAFTTSWKDMRKRYKVTASRPCETIDKKFSNSSIKWYGLVIPYRPDTPEGQAYMADPLSLLGFGWWIDSGQTIWFKSKKARNQYLNYMNR